jgi:hypothetical protein
MAQAYKSIISFTKRSVFVSLTSGGRASRVGPRIRKRLRWAQPKVIDVIERQAGESWQQFLQRMEEVADLILLVDDELCEKLNLTSSEAALTELTEGQELVIALLRNEKVASPELQRIRIWLAMVDELDLDALSAVASGRWDLTRDKERLHWLYEPNERVTQGAPDSNGVLLDDDDKRLGERIRKFRDHVRTACTPCSRDMPSGS